MNISHKFILGIAMFSLIAGMASGQTAIVEYTFNTADGASSVQTNANSGTAGSAWNGSFSATTAYASQSSLPPVNGSESWAGYNSTSTQNLNSGFYSPTANLTDLDNLGALTICMWVNVESVGSGAARMISYTNGSSSQGFDVYGTPASGYTLRIAGTGADAVSPTISGSTWVFFAVTFDGSSDTNNVSYYTGDGSTLSIATTATLAKTSTGDPGSTSLAVFDHSAIGRPTKGYFDDVRIYGSVLNSTQLDSIMKINDVTPVPEPANVALVFAAISGLLALRLRASGKHSRA